MDSKLDPPPPYSEVVGHAGGKIFFCKIFQYENQPFFRLQNPILSTLHQQLLA